MTNIDIRELSAELSMDSHGIWVANESGGQISYPAEAHGMCFNLENDSYWFAHRNNVISTLFSKYIPRKDCAQNRILDIGGGNGYVSSRLIHDGYSVVLLEPGPEGALNAKKRGLENVICATLRTAKFKSSSFDAAGAFDVIEHIEDECAFIEEIASTIKPDGIFCATVPAYNLLWSKKDEYAGHKRRYTVKQLVSLLAPWFKPLFASYMFRPLVLPILILRTLPSLLPFFGNAGALSAETEHGTEKGLVPKVMRILLASERKRIATGKPCSFGSTIVFVGRKVIL